eukprot:TRINITY_DN97830_c0_g1_i1.p1 TRINITY_DN97830_c0_g1~~TRINITY_DN97830_c0_g1_i1.p1  ORF type:complete len:575 (+),score=193.21 TRINITY_DN97830_c0_g1_i1:106-1830(+)
MELTFSIHQDLWQDAWVAATTAARSKKRQVDFNVKQRVDRLLHDYGPESGKPLTLRVYGTMLKGFCVINNDRARVLYVDCERVVQLFAQQPYSEEATGVKLPAAKRQRVDALTLDLDLARVQEAEAFDWTQAPLEDGALLSLGADAALEMNKAGSDCLALVGLPKDAPPSLLEETGLLDEAFPGLDAPAADLPPAAAAEAPPGGFGEFDAEMHAVPATPSEAGALLPLSDLSAVRPTDGDAALSLAEELIAEELMGRHLPEPPAKRRRPRLPPKMVPGKVYGFDEQVQLSAEEFNEWQESISTDLMGPAEFAAQLPNRAVFAVNHLGPLRALLDPPETEFRSAAAAATARAAAIAAGVALPAHHRFQPEFMAGPGPMVPGLQRADDELSVAAPPSVGGASEAPDVQELLGAAGGDAVRPEMLGAIFAEPPGGAAFVEAAAQAAQAAAEAQQLDPFQPYTVQAPLPSTQQAGAEIAGILQAGGEVPLEEVFEGKEAEVKYDLTTAQVGVVIKKFVERGGQEAGERGVLLDDLIPPASTDRVTAAKTFGSLLALATAGDLFVQQSTAYGPIAISVP